MSKTKIALVLSLLFCANSFANTVEPQQKPKNDRGFFSDDARGWHFYEDPKEDEDKEDEDVTINTLPPVSSEQSEMKQEVRLDIQWLRDNIPKLMDAAQNNPTKENISKYAYAQRLMLDMSSRFATKMSEYMAMDTLLDEEKRRPTTTIGLSGFSKQIYESKKQAMDLINEKAHLWYFYKSTCPYCQKQTPILNTLHELYGTEILAITMDNVRSPGMESFKHRADTNLIASRKMGVTRTPTIVMMKNDGSGYVNVTVGIETLERLEDRIILLGKEMGLISDELYEKTKAVYDVNSVKKIDGVLVADKDRLEKDPDYFIELMKTQLEMNSQRFNNSSEVAQ